MAKRKFKEEEVLDKAVQLFWKQGYEATTAKQLVEHLGITTGSLYHAFGDKHTLFMRALQHYYETYIGRLIGMLDSEPDGKKAIQNFFQVMKHNYASEKGSQGCMLTNSVVELAIHDPDVHQSAHQMLTQQEEAFYRAVKRGQEQGSISSATDARILAAFLNNGFQGMNVQIKACGDPEALTGIIQLVLSILD